MQLCDFLRVDKEPAQSALTAALWQDVRQAWAQMRNRTRSRRTSSSHSKGQSVLELLMKEREDVITALLEAPCEARAPLAEALAVLPPPLHGAVARAHFGADVVEWAIDAGDEATCGHVVAALAQPQARNVAVLSLSGSPDFVTVQRLLGDVAKLPRARPLQLSLDLGAPDLETFYQTLAPTPDPVLAHIVHLQVGSNGSDEYGIDGSAAQWGVYLSVMTALTLLHLCSTGLDMFETDELSDALSKLSRLQDLSLDGNLLCSGHGDMPLAPAIGALTALTSLSLHWTTPPLDDLAPHLAKLTRLQCLDLAYNDHALCDEFSKALGPVMSCLVALTELDLSSTYKNFASAAALAPVLAPLTRLAVLDLSEDGTLELLDSDDEGGGEGVSTAEASLRAHFSSLQALTCLRLRE